MCCLSVCLAPPHVYTFSKAGSRERVRLVVRVVVTKAWPEVARCENTCGSDRVYKNLQITHSHGAQRYDYRPECRNTAGILRCAMAALMARRAAPTSWRRASWLLGDPGRVFVMLALRSASTHLARDLLEAEHRVGLVHQRAAWSWGSGRASP